jgi:hypothetical protein
MLNDDAVILGSGQANTRVGSQVHVDVAPSPEAYLRLDTGEVIGVPAEDATELNNEFDTWNRLMYEKLLANEVLAVCDGRLEAIAREKAKNPNRPDPYLNTQEQEARKVQNWGIQWRDEVTEKLRGELKALDKLGGSGKKLIELIPLVRKQQKTPYQYEGKNEDWKRDGLDLKKVWSFKSGVGMRNDFKQKDRYRGLGDLRYMNSGKLKKSWPKFKDEKVMKWAEVYQKDKQGNRGVDRKKLRQYLGEQVQGMKVSSKDFVKLEIENIGTLGPEALEKWNADSHVEREGELKAAGVKLGDVDFGAEAAAMRYFSGAGVSGEIAPLKGNVNIKAEGSAEVAFAEGKAGCEFYFPCKEGLLLTFYDLEQISTLAKGGKPGAPYDLGAVRLLASGELSGVIGVSLAGEVSIGVEMVDIETKDVDGKTKSGKVPCIKGSRKKAKRKNKLDVNGKGDDWTNKAGADAEVSFFAGARGGIELQGAVQWRNPHHEDKKFEDFASIAPKLEGMAGLAGEAKLAVEYVDGIFRITAHAGLCFGVGASGEVSIAVGAKQLASFTFWMYYTLGHAGFRSLEFVAKEPFEAWKGITYLMVCEGKVVEKYFGTADHFIHDRLVRWDTAFAKADACLALGNRILATPEKVRFSPPETKGMLIHQLTRFSAANWTEAGLGLFDNYLPTQRKAVLAVLRQAQTKADMENIIQHIDAQGAKRDYQAKLEDLKRFFAAEGPHGFDMPGTRTQYQDDFQNQMRRVGNKDFVAMNGDFGVWYEEMYASLKDDMTRGYPALDNSTLQYAMQKDMGRDHPLFASSEGGFYSDKA